MQMFLIKYLIKFLIRYLKYVYYICDMNLTRKQKQIKKRRENVYKEYTTTLLSTTDMVDKLSKKLNVSSVTIYADIKHLFLEWSIKLKEYAKKFDYPINDVEDYRDYFKDGYDADEAVREDMSNI